jgi:hypothetical protein
VTGLLKFAGEIQGVAGFQKGRSGNSAGKPNGLRDKHTGNCAIFARRLDAVRNGDSGNVMSNAQEAHHSIGRLSLGLGLLHHLVAQLTCAINEPLQKVWAIYARVDVMEY